VKLKLFDILAVCLSLSIAGILAAEVYGRDNAPARVMIRNEDSTLVYPMDAERTVPVEGPIGITEVRIGDGWARVASSPCPDKLCVKSGMLRRKGDWSACMPNKVFVRITGVSESGVDAGTY
jgi:hypothetical protein